MHVQVPVEVASFLLNEKRPEIAKIELKQRVTVLMVPNKTLETPNYKLERLKHDDPRLDHIEASYKMADEIEDPTSVTRRSQEPTNKQTPVIKGVLPDAPAPVAVPKPEAGARAGGRARRAGRRAAPAAAPRAGRDRLLRLDQEPVRRRPGTGAGARAGRDSGRSAEARRDRDGRRGARRRSAAARATANSAVAAAVKAAVAVMAKPRRRAP